MFAIILPKIAEPTLPCLEFPREDGGSIITSQFFTAVKNKEGKWIRCDEIKQCSLISSYKVIKQTHTLRSETDDRSASDTPDDPSSNKVHMTASSVPHAEDLDEAPSHLAPGINRILCLLRSDFVKVKDGSRSSETHRWKDGRCLPFESVMFVLENVIPFLERDPTLLELEPPTYVFGDLHGNYNDLMTFAKAFGLLNTASIVPAKFLFLGDYVDRGSHGLEILMWLFSMKILYPKKVFLLRGNHEFSFTNMSPHYGQGSFYKQLIDAYGKENGERICSAANRAFAYLSLAAVIDRRIFCAHGGIPRGVIENRSLDVLDIIRRIRRPIDVEHPSDFDENNRLPLSHLCFDLLCTDPSEKEEETEEGKVAEGFFESSHRDGGIVWSKLAVREFLCRTQCSHIIRAHQLPSSSGAYVQDDATVFTIFSSSGYDGDNGAAVALISEGTIRVIRIPPV